LVIIARQDGRPSNLRPADMEKGRLSGPSMSLVRLNEPGLQSCSPKEDVVQAEGCPVKTNNFPLPATQTEISLDIGPPSFHYVDDDQKVGAICGACKASYVNNRRYY
jgi:hypothetical protein